MPNKLQKSLISYQGAIVVIFLVAFLRWALLMGIVTIGMQCIVPTSLEDTCTPTVEITPETQMVGLRHTFLMNEDVTVEVLLKLNPDCTYVEKASVMSQGKTYYFDYTEPLQASLDTKSLEDKVRIEIFGKTAEEGPFESTLVIEILTESEYGFLQLERLALFSTWLLAGVSVLYAEWAKAKRSRRKKR